MLKKVVKKEKRIPLSVIRLYKLASLFSTPVNSPIIRNFLKFVSDHKNDEL